MKNAEKKYRIPRKLKKQIPVGHYCYELIHYDMKTGNSKVKMCPFYASIQCKDKPEKYQNEIDKEYPEEYVGWCKLVIGEIDDQCKSCATRDGSAIFNKYYRQGREKKRRQKWTT